MRKKNKSERMVELAESMHEYYQTSMESHLALLQKMYDEQRRQGRLLDQNINGSD